MRSTPFANGASIVDLGVANLFTLCCPCGESYTFKLNQLKTSVVSESAYLRGYGTSREIVPTAQARRVKVGQNL